MESSIRDGKESKDRYPRGREPSNIRKSQYRPIQHDVPEIRRRETDHIALTKVYKTGIEGSRCSGRSCSEKEYTIAGRVVHKKFASM